MRKRVIGVMGGSAAGADACRLAYRLGQLVAAGGDVLLCGGRPEGVMDAAARGARDRGGLTVGILPGSDPDQAADTRERSRSGGGQHRPGCGHRPGECAQCDQCPLQ